MAGQSVAELKTGAGEDLGLFTKLRQQGLLRERPLVVETLKAIAAGKISLENAEAASPLDLTEQVESRLVTA